MELKDLSRPPPGRNPVEGHCSLSAMALSAMPRLIRCCFSFRAINDILCLANALVIDISSSVMQAFGDRLAFGCGKDVFRSIVGRAVSKQVGYSITI